MASFIRFYWLKTYLTKPLAATRLIAELRPIPIDWTSESKHKLCNNKNEILKPIYNIHIYIYIYIP